MNEIVLILFTKCQHLGHHNNSGYSAIDNKTKRQIRLLRTAISKNLTDYLSLIHYVNPGLLTELPEQHTSRVRCRLNEKKASKRYLAFL